MSQPYFTTPSANVVFGEWSFSCFPSGSDLVLIRFRSPRSVQAEPSLCVFGSLPTSMNYARLASRLPRCSLCNARRAWSSVCLHACLRKYFYPDWDSGSRDSFWLLFIFTPPSAAHRLLVRTTRTEDGEQKHWNVGVKVSPLRHFIHTNRARMEIRMKL